MRVRPNGISRAALLMIKAATREGRARRAARAKLDERAGRGFVGYTECASEPKSAMGGAATMTVALATQPCAKKTTTRTCRRQLS